MNFDDMTIRKLTNTLDNVAKLSEEYKNKINRKSGIDTSVNKSGPSEGGGLNDCYKYYTDRLTTLMSSFGAGNYPNINLQNEIAQISDFLLKQGAIDKRRHKEIYSKYIL